MFYVETNKNATKGLYKSFPMLVSIRRLLLSCNESMLLLTFELIALVWQITVLVLCSLLISLRTLFFVMVGGVLTSVLVTITVNSYSRFTVSVHARALALDVNVCTR